MGFLPIFSTRSENAVSASLHFQRLTSPKMAGRPAPHGKRQQIGASLVLDACRDSRPGSISFDGNLMRR
jgi:hypothetical protein